jgi:hypothetical protein
MQAHEHYVGGKRASEEADYCGPLVVLNRDLGPVARTTLWIKAREEGYDLLVAPRLHVEQHAALRLLSGMSPAKLFAGCELITPHWTEKLSGYVGGQWYMHIGARSEFRGAAFVLGADVFNIERAVRGAARLLT